MMYVFGRSADNVLTCSPPLGLRCVPPVRGRGDTVESVQHERLCESLGMYFIKNTPAWEEFRAAQKEAKTAGMSGKPHMRCLDLHFKRGPRQPWCGLAMISTSAQSAPW